MRNTNTLAAAGQSDLESRPVFNVVLAYDEYASGIRAKEFFEALANDDGDLFQFICHLWKFEALREPRLFNVASRDASRADMVVLAIHQSQELKQADSGSIVTLLGGQAGHAGNATSIPATLRQLTEGAQIQFFCKEIDWPAMDSHFAMKITKTQLREEPWRHATLPSPYAGQPRWGLNE